MSIVVIDRHCLLCGRPSSVEVPAHQYEEYQRGSKVQHAFPDIPADQREVIISGVHPRCFDKAFKEEE